MTVETYELYYYRTLELACYQLPSYVISNFLDFDGGYEFERKSYKSNFRKKIQIVLV